MNIHEIKKYLVRTGKKYEVKVQNGDVDKAQRFLIKNGFEWYSGTKWVNLIEDIYVFTLIYLKNEKRYCLMFNSYKYFLVKEDHTLNFRDLISKDLVEENFITNLFKDII